MEYNAFMGFDPEKYGEKVAHILALDGDRLTSLTCAPCTNTKARRLLAAHAPAELFPRAKEPETAMSGLWLHFSCFEEAHQLADASKSAEGALWHGIVHRHEPDYGNAAYWFRRAGNHATFPDTARAASGILKGNPDVEFRVGRWDPYSFIAFCERSTSPSETVSRSVFGISMPIALRPGMGERMRTSFDATA